MRSVKQDPRGYCAVGLVLPVRSERSDDKLA